jgi:hypothetical protein
MTRTLSALVASAFLLAAPAFAEEAVKSKKKETRADGTQVETKVKKDVNADGTGEAKKETTTKDPATGAETTKSVKVKKSKNADGTVDTKTETKTETKK